MKLKYDWGNDFRIQELLTKIYIDSIKKLEENHYHGESYALEFMLDVEEFLYGIKQLFPSYFDNVVDSLYNLEGITFVPMREGIGFPVEKVSNTILVDPSTVVNNGVSCSAGFKRMCVFYGLAMVAFNFSKNNIQEFTQRFDRNLSNEMVSSKEKVKTKGYINDGWILLEEVLAEKLAKMVYHNLLENENISETDNQDILDGRKLSVHSEDYISFDILVRFGLTVSSKAALDEYSSNVIMINMLKKALRGNLVEEIITEYTDRGLVNELYSVLYDMGEIHGRRKQIYPLVLLDDQEEKDVYMSLLLKMAYLINFNDSENLSNKLTKKPGSSLMIRTKE